MRGERGREASDHPRTLRTAHRDVAALRERGEPIDGGPGRGGGFRLGPLRSLPAVRLGVDEVVGLVMAAALAAGGGAPFGVDARRALHRAMSTLPAPRSADLRRVLARRILGFDYVDRNGQATSRRAEPHGLLAQAPALYRLAHDLDREAPRMFRLDRMYLPTVRPERFVPDPHRVFVPLVQEIGGPRPAVEMKAAPLSSSR